MNQSFVTTNYDPSNGRINGKSIRTTYNLLSEHIFSHQICNLNIYAAY
jgi:hypothetical protein